MDGSACLFEAGRDPDLRGFGETQLKIKPGMCFDHASFFIMCYLMPQPILTIGETMCVKM